MSRPKVAIFIVSIIAAHVSISRGAPIVIAGSELIAPPKFFQNSSWSITPRVDRAFPFTVISDGSFFAEKLQIPARYDQFIPGTRAKFTVHEDAQGEPGNEIGDFHMEGISADVRLHTAAATTLFTLEGETKYWIIGQIASGQVHWHLGFNSDDTVTLGQVAYRVDDGEWVFDDDRNISAFAILGQPVPEPSSTALVSFSSLGMLYFRRRKDMPTC